ncbi:MAG: hypothetical protein ACPG6P_12970 [Akkermansiaceae bacterium]
MSRMNVAQLSFGIKAKPSRKAFLKAMHVAQLSFGIKAKQFPRSVLRWLLKRKTYPKLP